MAMKRIFLGLVCGMVVYELVALADKDEGDTISELFWTVSTKRAIVPFALGVLMGHLFWQKDGS